MQRFHTDYPLRVTKPLPDRFSCQGTSDLPSSDTGGQFRVTGKTRLRLLMFQGITGCPIFRIKVIPTCNTIFAPPHIFNFYLPPFFFTGCFCRLPNRNEFSFHTIYLSGKRGLFRFLKIDFTITAYNMNFFCCPDNATAHRTNIVTG